MINLSIYLIFNSVLFGTAILSILINRKNLIFLIMSIELMLLAVSSNFVTYARLWNDINGQIIVLFVLAVSAAEMAVGLAVLLKLFKTKSSINLMDLSVLKN